MQLTRIALIALAFSSPLVACDDDPPATLPNPVGSWSSADGLHACFTADHRAGFNDAVLTAYDGHSVWSDDGTLGVYDEPTDANLPATWSIKGGQLVVTLPVSCDDETVPGTCALTYARDAAARCFP